MIIYDIEIYNYKYEINNMIEMITKCNVFWTYDIDEFEIDILIYEKIEWNYFLIFITAFGLDSRKSNVLFITTIKTQNRIKEI